MTQVYEGVQLTPPRVSLLSAADKPTVEGERWYNGFDVITEGCEAGKVYAVCPPDGAAAKTLDGTGGTQLYEPFVIYATDKCSTYPAGREFYDRAQRKLLTAESTLLEQQLWTGSLGLGNPKLADATTTHVLSAPVPTNVTDAIAIMDQAIGACSASRGMIHIRPQLLPDALKYNAVRREGNVYLTGMDTIVVPGRGYPGTGPTGQAVGAREWIYGHPGIVQIRQGPVIRLGEDDLGSQVTRTTNDRTVIVERVTHVALDPTCCVYALSVASLGAITIT